MSLLSHLAVFQIHVLLYSFNRTKEKISSARKSVCFLLNFNGFGLYLSVVFFATLQLIFNFKWVGRYLEMDGFKELSIVSFSILMLFI